MNIVIDGVFFQLADTGIARVWRSALPLLAARPGMSVTVLDRGDCPRFQHVRTVAFPSYTDRYNAADSELLQSMCTHLAADLFVSTYYTTPITTPSIAVVYDMIPERMNFEMGMRAWQEKELCIAHGRRHLCISEQARSDLLDFYPELDPANVLVATCGVDPEIFKPRSLAQQASLQTRLGIARPYFLVVGSRTQNKGYKNIRLLFEALATMRPCDRDVLCVGGDARLEDWITELTPPGCTVHHARLSDEDLAAAYGAAEALVYPSLYEGFGLPVAEAMACGCPVITSRRGSLAEVAGTAALTIDGHSVEEMRSALIAVRDVDVGADLRRKGLQQAARFRWSAFVEGLEGAMLDTVRQARAGRFDRFHQSWAALRALQGAVDVIP